MSFHGRACHISQMAADARSVLQEVERDRQRERIEELLEEARRDPIAPYRAGGKKWYPRFVVWELTLACNMRCKHCGSSAGRARSDELTLDEMYRVCDELGELECERVTLLGGEPLIHPHWEKVARRMRENGYRANVITNGWTLDREELCDRLKKAELSIVGMSIDGLEESHDNLRGKPGSFSHLARGLELLQEREVPTAVATVITNDSLDELPELYAWLRGRGVRVWQLQVANPLGRMDPDHPVLIKPVRLKELYDFVMTYREKHDDIRIDIADNVGYFGPAEHAGIRQKRPGEAFYWTGCHAGIQAMGLDSNGDVKGCQSHPSTPEYIVGNVRERPLREIWNDPSAFRHTRGFKLSDLRGFCATCRWGPLCKAGCTSAAVSYRGHWGDNPMCIYRVLEEEKQP